MKNAAFLLVEDEVLLRMMTAEMLEELGRRVVAEAGTIGAAEPLARSLDFDLAVLDINVGGTSIAPIADILSARRLPFIFVSGYRFCWPTGVVSGQASFAKALFDLKSRYHDGQGIGRRAQCQGVMRSALEPLTTLNSITPCSIVPVAPGLWFLPRRISPSFELGKLI
jgi:hypothetical protein